MKRRPGAGRGKPASRSAGARRSGPGPGCGFAQADLIIFLYSLFGCICGGIVGAMVAPMLHREVQTDSSTVFWGGVLLVGLLAFAAGRSRAFVLKLQAQQALCQVQIEENTRRADDE